MTSVLRNPRDELYAQGIVAGLSRQEAYIQAGFKGRNPNHIHNKPPVQKRIAELLKLSAARSELSRREILDRIFQDWELGRKLGQVSAALKAAELYGRETHKMFTERKEVGGPGDFDNKSEEELREMITRDMKDLGWEDDIIPPKGSVN
jgi:hypothetical protein